MPPPAPPSAGASAYASLDAGDVLLFSCQCLGCASLRGKVLCTILQEGTNSAWNHIAVVVVDPADGGRKYVLESRWDGAVLTPLGERLEEANAEGYTVVCRRLDFPRGAALRGQLWERSQAVVAAEYHQSMLRLVDGAIVKTEARQSLEYLTAHRGVYVSQLEDLEGAMAQASVTLLQRRSLSKEVRRVKRKLTNIEAQLAYYTEGASGDGGAGGGRGGRLSESAVARGVLSMLPGTLRRDIRTEDGETRVSLNNSELVAALYQHVGLLPAPLPDAVSYSPKDFSNEGDLQAIPRLQLKNRARLMREEVLVRAPEKAVPLSLFLKQWTGMLEAGEDVFSLLPDRRT